MNFYLQLELIIFHQTKVVVHIDPFGSADAIPCSLSAPPFVVIKIQPMAGELSRYVVTSSDETDEGEQDIIQTERIPGRIIQTSALNTAIVSKYNSSYKQYITMVYSSSRQGTTPDHLLPLLASGRELLSLDLKPFLGTYSTQGQDYPVTSLAALPAINGPNLQSADPLSTPTALGPTAA